MSVPALPRSSAVRLKLLLGFLLLPSAAFGHPGHCHPDEVDEFDAFVPGLVHPLGGLDHLLLALAVGWLAFSRMNIRPGLVLPVFIVSLLGGALLGKGAEGGVLLEVFLAGTLLAAGGMLLTRISRHGASLIVAATAGVGVLHGFAHGAGSSGGGGFFFYITGVSISTAALCGLGGLFAYLANRQSLPFSRVAGLVFLTFGVAGIFKAF